MPAKILIVEDDRRLLGVIRTRLLRSGYECTACENAQEAILHFASEDVELVITDMTMPGIDGLGVIALIRSHSDVPIIVITGHADDYGQLVKQYPHVMLLRKPFDPRVLATCVSTLIHRKAKAASL